MSDDKTPGLEEVPGAPISTPMKADFRVRVARGVGEAVARMPYSDHDLVVHLGNVLKIFDHNVSRAKSPLGAIVNLLMQRDLENVELDGLVILQACELAGQPPLPNVRTGARYKIPALAVRCLLEAIADKTR